MHAKNFESMRRRLRCNRTEQKTPRRVTSPEAWNYEQLSVECVSEGERYGFTIISARTYNEVHATEHEGLDSTGTYEMKDHSTTREFRLSEEWRVEEHKQADYRTSTLWYMYTCNAKQISKTIQQIKLRLYTEESLV